ncbi:hypothetical protein AB8615_11000 [Litorimonas sp. RW-G-Af-16]|uniref:hypothetical protein n=1 Tax=Litorimonas sp. RW-G-Af-16 TaxID=3241168 RepID=UPI003AACB41B
MAQTSVYIVDDDEAVRDSLNVLLLTHDYNPKLYPSGEAFIEADLGSITGPILLDVRMPEPRWIGDFKNRIIAQSYAQSHYDEWSCRCFHGGPCLKKRRYGLY